MDRIRQQFKDIADMIRLRNGTTDSISASEMPELIRTLGGAQFIADSIVDTEKGTQTLAISTYKPPFIPVSCDPIFGNNSPEIISAVSKQIEANKFTSADIKTIYGWSVGDTVSYKLTTDESIEMRIIGFNHDDKANNKGKAGITLEMTHCLKTLSSMNSSNTNSGGYASSLLHLETLPLYKSLIPQEWRNIIKPIIKKCANNGGTNYPTLLDVTVDLFVLSKKEMIDIENMNLGEDRQYEYWQLNNPNLWAQEYKAIKYYDSNNDGTLETAVNYWLRSPHNRYTASWWIVSNKGSFSSDESAINKLGVSFAFCV